MKITRRQLKRLILKEFDMSGMMGSDIDGLLGVGGQPPVKPPGRRGGGGEPRKAPCAFGQPKGNRYYKKVSKTFPAWVEHTFPLTPEEESYNDAIVSKGNQADYDLLITEYGKYLVYLTDAFPTFSMNMVSDNFNEFFELIMTMITEYACNRSIKDLTKIYKNPIPAINNF